MGRDVAGETYYPILPASDMAPGENRIFSRGPVFGKVRPRVVRVPKRWLALGRPITWFSGNVRLSQDPRKCGWGPWGRPITRSSLLPIWLPGRIFLSGQRLEMWDPDRVPKKLVGSWETYYPTLPIWLPGRTEFSRGAGILKGQTSDMAPG